MKRSLIALLGLALFLAVNAFADMSIEEEIAGIKRDIAEMKSSKENISISETLGLVAGISGTIISQCVDKANDGSGQGRTDGSYRLDLMFGKEFENNLTVFLRIRGYNGEGLNNKLQLYSYLNETADNDQRPYFSIAELWTQKNLFDNKLTLSFGIMDPKEYFDINNAANEETYQFLAAMFVNNPAILFPDFQLGLRATYSPAEFLDITYAYFNQNDSLDHIDTGGFNAVQADFKLVKDKFSGNYRLMYWSSNEKINDEHAYGIALSIDHTLSETVFLFARYGYTNPKAADDENPLESSWSLGAQINGKLWNREKHILGMAIGRNRASKDWIKANDLKDDPETQTELYYKFNFNEHIALTPVFQYVVKPAGGNAASDNNLSVFGLRTQINF
ncbi:MAG: carbohydrate porin [Endomicrobia bacterium]|nr:carbohydrate porin [Endomicrobiia bacterium]